MVSEMQSQRLSHILTELTGKKHMSDNVNDITTS